MKRLLLILALLSLPMSLPALAQIPVARVKQIQRAMKLHGYSCHISGELDAQTVNLMKQIQKDQGWQSKVVPDSRLLILIGLGPSYGHLINPRTAWVADVRRKF